MKQTFIQKKQLSLIMMVEAFLSFAYLKELKREAAKLLEETNIVESYRRRAKRKEFFWTKIMKKQAFKKPKLMVSVLT